MKHQVTTLLALISVFVCGLLNAQPQVFTNPDKILHLAAEDSLANFGNPLRGEVLSVNAISVCKMNSDQYDDLIIFAPGGINISGETVGEVNVFLGSENGVSVTPSQTIFAIRTVNDNQPYGGCLTGDFNNDGRNDLLIGIENYNLQGNVSQGYAICFFGKNDGTGIDTTNKLIIEAQGGSGNFAHLIAKGDFNDDEADDLLISAIHDAGYTGRIYCYFGGTNFDEIPDITFSRDGSTVLGSNTLKVSDVNNDSFDDIIALDVPGWNPCSLQMSIFEGANPMNTQPMYVHGIDGMLWMQANDINGDGFDDIIGTSHTGLNCNGTAPYHYITIIKGSAEYSLDSFLLIPFQGQVAMPSNFQNSIDVNNDGINDVFMTMKKDDGTKESYIFAGHPSDYINLSDTLFKFVDTDNSYGNTIENIIPADCNGDGKPEFYGYSQMAPYKSVIFVYDNMPQMEKIFFSAKPANEDFYSIYSMNIDGTSRVQLFSDNYHRRCPIISKDHSEIFYLKRKLDQEHEGDSVWICKSNIDGANEQQLWTNPTPLSFGLRTNFDVSPDNQKLIYAVFSEIPPGRDGDIFEYDFQSQATTNLTNDWDYLEDDPVYSPGDSKIVYTKNGTTWYSSPWLMYRMNTDGTGNELFQPNGDGHYSRPEFSPDGAKFTFCYAPVVGMLYSMYVANGDGTGPQQIIPSAGSSSGLLDPTFNPSGTQLAFASENNSQLVITDFTGNILQQIDTTGINGFYEIEWGVVGGTGLPDPAGPITGPSEVCQGETGVQFSIEPIANATSYVWTLPEGATIVGGENTTTITVNFSNTAVSGNISVYGTNANGNGDPSPDFFVTVNPLPVDIGQPTININSLNEGLVAYYPFDGDATDMSGNGNHGTLEGPTPAPDRLGNPNGALNFEGINNPQFVYVPNSASLQFTDQASFCYWFSLDKFFGMNGWGQPDERGVHVIFSKDYDQCCMYSDISSDISNNLYGGFMSDGFYNGIRIHDTIPEGDTAQWIHLGYVIHPDYCEMYVNGTLVDTTQGITSFENSNSRDLYFGRLSSFWYPFDGKLDDVRFYNRALTAEEVTCLYTGDCDGQILSAELTNNSICENESTSIEIINTQPGISYQLIKGQVNYGEPQVGNGDTLVFPVSGLVQTSNFQILATDTATGCFITLDTTLVVNVYAINAVVTNDTAICAGSPVILSASGGDSYLWSNGMTTPEITVIPEITTTYSVTISNVFGCYETQDIVVTVHPLPLDIGESTVNLKSLKEILTAWYPFNGNTNDQSGNGYHGTPLNSPEYSYDRFNLSNAALKLNGTNQYVSLPNTISLTNDISISFWIKTSTSDNGSWPGGTFIIDRDLCSLERDWSVGLGSGGKLQFNTGTFWNDKVLTSDLNVNDDNWKHIVVIRNTLNQTKSININGQLNKSESLDNYQFDNNSINIYIGASVCETSSHHYYNGVIDDISIYNRALTAEEVSALYSGSSAGDNLSVEVTNDTICKGSSSSINIYNSQPNIEYQLFRDGSAYGNPLTGDGNTLTFPINDLTVTSSFQIQATDPVTDCMIVLDTTLTVTVVNVTAKANAYATSEFVPTTVNCSSQSEGAVTWEWYIDGTLFSNQPQPQLIIEEPGQHEIVLSVSSGPPANCSDSDTVIIITQEIIQVNILIPSSFTPNNDNINDKLEIVFDGAASADVWIKDQWGVLMKEYDGLAEKWNGLTASGKEAPAAPYFCIVEATDKAGGTHEKQGIVYLFRDDVDVSPNPASKQVLVQTNGRIPGERIVRIYSPMGEIMIEMKPTTDDFEIDLSQFQSGIYFLQISNGIDQLTTKIIKQ